MLNMTSEPGQRAICTGMSPPGGGKEQASAQTSRCPGLRKREDLDTRDTAHRAHDRGECKHHGPRVADDHGSSMHHGSRSP